MWVYNHNDNDNDYNHDDNYNNDFHHDNFYHYDFHYVNHDNVHHNHNHDFWSYDNHNNHDNFLCADMRRHLYLSMEWYCMGSYWTGLLYPAARLRLLRLCESNWNWRIHRTTTINQLYPSVS